MNSIYILFYISSIIISSLVTAILIDRKLIMRKWVEYKEKRSIQRQKRLKSVVENIVLNYLNELKNGESND